MLEAGSLSAAEYEAQVRARPDFQRLQRRDSDGERQVCDQAVELAQTPREAGRWTRVGTSGASVLRTLSVVPRHHRG